MGIEREEKKRECERGFSSVFNITHSQRRIYSPTFFGLLLYFLIISKLCFITNYTNFG